MTNLDWRTVGLWLVLLATPGCAGDGLQADDDDADSAGDTTAGPSSGQHCGERDAPDATADELAEYALRDLEVGTRLLDVLGADMDNVLLSPLSLRLAFGQVLAGSRGASAEEISATLGFDALAPGRVHDVLNSVSQTLGARNAMGNESTPELTVRTVNRAFVDLSYEERLEEAWVAQVQASYGTCIEPIDINGSPDSALEHINGWVAEQTEDLIPNLVKNLPPVTAMVLVNAVYYKAAWAAPFDEGRTNKAPFITRGGGEITVEMMHAPEHQGRYAEGDGWQAVSLPYDDRRLEMVIVLPVLDTQAEFEASLDAFELQDIFAALDPTIIDLKLPKFELLSQLSLANALRSLGMSAPFENAEDFDPIAKGMLAIDQVFHDVAIAIDEKGTVAAAATAVVFGDDGGNEPEPVADMVVDRTFYLAIRDREVGAVLFFGRIGDPNAV